MRVINPLLLFTTLVASITLLGVMWQRRLSRRLLLFFVLLVFYVVRSAVLLVAVRLFNPATYANVSELMSLLDIVLQLVLAYSLIHFLTRLRRNAKPAGSRLLGSAVFLFSAALLCAALLTMGVVAALPVYSPVPLDRAIVFTGFVFLLLLLFVRRRGGNTPESRLLIGFSIASAANIIAQYGRTLSAAQNDPTLFLLWAYANAVVWIGVLVFWIIRLRPTSPATLPTRASAQPSAQLT